jgi:hypothetical protein
MIKSPSIESKTQFRNDPNTLKFKEMDLKERQAEVKGQERTHQRIHVERELALKKR